MQKKTQSNAEEDDKKTTKLARLPLELVRYT